MDRTSNMSERRLRATAGWLLLITLGGIFLRHFGAQAIAGQPLSGPHDTLAIAAYYGHGALTGVYWLTALTYLAFVGFLIAFRSIIAERGDAIARLFADMGAAFGLVELPILFLELALSAALVALSGSAAGESSAAMLGVFASWDWIFNGMADWLELGMLGMISLACGRSGLIPRWLVALGVVAALLRPVSALVLVAGLPVQLKLLVTLPFIAWFLAMGISLVRTANRERRARPE